MTAAAKVDPDGFLLVVSTLPGRSPVVRARRPGRASWRRCRPITCAAALEDLVADADVRVQAPALEALARVGAPDLTKRLFDALEAPDFVLRATAARSSASASRKPACASLVAAYDRGGQRCGRRRASRRARRAREVRRRRRQATLRRARRDRDWPVRLRAADAAAGAGEATADAVAARAAAPAGRVLRVRPRCCARRTRRTRSSRPGAAPSRSSSTSSTRRSPTHAFIELARAGFFNGMKVHRLVPNFVIQAGDPARRWRRRTGLHDSRRAEPAAVRARHGRHGARRARHRRQSVLHHALAAAASRWRSTRCSARS